MTLKINTLIKKMDELSEGGYAEWRGKLKDKVGIKINNCKISIASISAVLFAYKTNPTKKRSIKKEIKQPILIMANKAFNIFKKIIENKDLTDNETSIGEGILELVDFSAEIDLDGNFSRNEKNIKKIYNYFLSGDFRGAYNLFHILQQANLD